MPPRKKPVRRKKASPASVGLTPTETRNVSGDLVAALSRQVDADGGAVIGSYNDPFGGKPLLLVALPVDRVEPRRPGINPSPTLWNRCETDDWLDWSCASFETPASRAPQDDELP